MTAPILPPGTPDAEIEIGPDLVRRLLAAQHPDLADLPIALAASGWDNMMFRLGENLAVRLPRRAMAAALLWKEQAWMPRLPALPLAAPLPRRLGRPGDDFPWAWSVIPWLEGETADLALPDAGQGAVLGGFFQALHRPAPADAPRSAYRGVPLISREAHFKAQLDYLAARDANLSETMLDLWRAGIAAPDDAADTWLHGDLHPRNVLVRDGRITAMLDWGDMAQGDRASDLSAVWMLLPDRAARAEAMALADASEATWTRARGWAVWYGATLRANGLANDPRMGVIAERIFARLGEGP